LYSDNILTLTFSHLFFITLCCVF